MMLVLDALTTPGILRIFQEKQTARRLVIPVVGPRIAVERTPSALWERAPTRNAAAWTGNGMVGPSRSNAQTMKLANKFPILKMEQHLFLRSRTFVQM